MTDLSYLMKMPYGIPYNCYYAVDTIRIEDSEDYSGEDGILSVDEELERIIVIN